jgi:hypothetical protein
MDKPKPMSEERFSFLAKVIESSGCASISGGAAFDLLTEVRRLRAENAELRNKLEAMHHE